MQLALEIELPDDATFNNFCWHQNEVLESQIKTNLRLRKDRFFYIWGPAGAGKSHVLQAITAAYHTDTAYLPLKQLKQYGPDALIGLDALSVICLDDIDSIAGDKAFEEALFHLYNKCRDNVNQMLFISGESSPSHSGIALPDLRSRLSWGLVFQLQTLNEPDKATVLMARASQKGLLLSLPVAQYLLTHCSRDMHHLKDILIKLDKASLAEKRKLTIPFVKRILHV